MWTCVKFQVHYPTSWLERDLKDLKKMKFLSYLQCDLSRQIVMLFVCPLQHSLSVQSVWTISSFSQFSNLKWFLSFEKRYSYLLFCSKNVLYYISVWPENKIWIFGFFFNYNFFNTLQYILTYWKSKFILLWHLRI